MHLKAVNTLYINLTERLLLETVEKGVHTIVVNHEIAVNRWSVNRKYFICMQTDVKASSGRDSLKTGRDCLGIGRDNLKTVCDSLGTALDSLGTSRDSLGTGPDSLRTGHDSIATG